MFFFLFSNASFYATWKFCLIYQSQQIPRLTKWPADPSAAQLETGRQVPQLPTNFYVWWDENFQDYKLVFFSIKYQGQSSVVNFTNGPEGIRGRENNGRPTYIRRNHLGLGVYGIYLHISNILYSSFKSYCAKKRQDCFEFPARRNFDEPEVCSRSLPNNAGSLFQVQSYRGVSKLPFRVRRFFYISKIMCSLQR